MRIILATLFILTMYSSGFAQVFSEWKKIEVEECYVALRDGWKVNDYERTKDNVHATITHTKYNGKMYQLIFTHDFNQSTYLVALECFEFSEK